MILRLNDLKNYMLSLFSIVIVSMILITSQSPAAFAGIGGDHDGDNDQYTPNQGDCDDNNPNVYPGHGCNPLEDIEIIINDIEELIEEGDLDINEGQANALLGKLEKAADNVESNNHNKAINLLNAFINQINAFINSGLISSEDGQTLIDAVQSIINVLEN